MIEIIKQWARFGLPYIWKAISLLYMMGQVMQYVINMPVHDVTAYDLYKAGKRI